MQLGEVLSWVLSVNSELEAKMQCLIFVSSLWGTRWSSGSGRRPLILGLRCIGPVSCREFEKRGEGTLKETASPLPLIPIPSLLALRFLFLRLAAFLLLCYPTLEGGLYIFIPLA